MIKIVPQPQGDERVRLTEITKLPVIVEYAGNIAIVLSKSDSAELYTAFIINKDRFTTDLKIPGKHPVFLHNEPVTIQNKK